MQARQHLQVPQSIPTDVINLYGDILMEGSPVVLNVLEIVEEEVEGIVYVGLIGGKPLPLTGAVKLFDSRPNRSFTVSVTKSIKLGWSEEDRAEKVNRLMEFNKKCFVTAINRKADRCRYYSLWAPLTDELDIDWKQIRVVFPALLTSFGPPVDNYLRPTPEVRSGFMPTEVRVLSVSQAVSLTERDQTGS
jgi:hypothetical protein